MKSENGKDNGMLPSYVTESACPPPPEKDKDDQGDSLVQTGEEKSQQNDCLTVESDCLGCHDCETPQESLEGMVLRHIQRTSGHEAIDIKALKEEFPDIVDLETGQVRRKFFEEVIRPLGRTIIDRDKRTITISMEPCLEDFDNVHLLIGVAIDLVEVKQANSPSGYNTRTISSLYEALRHYSRES
jgi:hypothetical protein